MMIFAFVTTPNCGVCGKSSTMVVDKAGFEQWRNGALIQNAFPDMSREERERLKTGTHPECWKKIFGGER